MWNVHQPHQKKTQILNVFKTELKTFLFSLKKDCTFSIMLNVIFSDYLVLTENLHLQRLTYVKLSFVLMENTNVTMETALINHWLTTAEMTVGIIVMKVRLF